MSMAWIGDWIAAVMLSIGLSLPFVAAAEEDVASPPPPPPVHAANASVATATTPTSAERRPALRMVEVVMLSPWGRADD
jgi:hypothetical protein